MSGEEPGSEAKLSPSKQKVKRRYRISMSETEVYESVPDGAPNGDVDMSDISSGDEQVTGSNDAVSGGEPAPVCCGFSSRQLRVMFVAYLAIFMSYLNYGLLIPFYPETALARGLTMFMIGLVFGVYALVIFATSLIIGKYLPQVGARYVLTGGYAMAGVTTIAFGSLEFVHTFNAFAILSFGSRILTAFFVSMLMNASLAIIAAEFPGKVSLMMGISELFIGLGFLFGPVFGGFLYTAGGFKMPFFVIGALIVVTSPICYFALPRDVGQKSSETNKKLGSIAQLIKIPTITTAAIAITFNLMVLGYLEPIFAPHMLQFNVTSIQVGLLLMVLAVAYCISSMICGKLVELRPHWSKMIILFGSIVYMLSQLMVGPSPLLMDILLTKMECTTGNATVIIPSLDNCYTVHSILTMNAIGAVVMGLSAGFSIVPGIQVFLDEAYKNGMNRDFSTQALVSGLFNTTMALGSLLGPVLGGLLADYLHTGWVITFGATFPFIGCTIFLGLVIAEKCGHTEQRISGARSVQMIEPVVYEDDHPSNLKAITHVSTLNLYVPLEKEASVNPSSENV